MRCAGLVLCAAAAAALLRAPAPAPRAAALAAKAKKKVKKTDRLRELQEVSGARLDATEQWAANLEKRLDAAGGAAPAAEALASVDDAARSDLDARVLTLCKESDRDLAALDAAIADLARAPAATPAAAARLAGGDWRLVWAKSDEGIGAIGTGLHRVPLAKLEDVFVSLDQRRVTVTEVIRVMGPFPNVKNVLYGAASVSPAKLSVSYDKVVDGTGSVITSSQARDAAFRVAGLSSRLMVLAAATASGDEWLVFEREAEFAASLEKLRVLPNDGEDADDDAAAAGGFELPWN